MKRILIVFLVLAFSGSLLVADAYIKTKTHTSAFEIMGQKQEAKDEITEQWVGKGRMAMVSPESKTLIDLGKNTIVMINHQDKTYLEAALPLDMSKLLPPEAAGMMAMMKPKVQVSPNGQVRKIGSWNCKGYDIKMEMMMMSMNIAVWATTEVPFDWKEHQKMSANLMNLQGQIIDEAAMKEFFKIEGVQIASEINMNVMGADMKVKTEVQEISDKNPPADLFSIPAGYKKIDHISMGR